MGISQSIGPHMRDGDIPGAGVGFLDLEVDVAVSGDFDPHNGNSAGVNDRSYLFLGHGRVRTRAGGLDVSRRVVGHVDIVADASIAGTCGVGYMRCHRVAESADVVYRHVRIVGENLVHLEWTPACTE